LVWLLVERPWSARANDDYDRRWWANGIRLPPGRRSGWVGFGWGLALNVAVNVLAVVAFWVWRKL
jgi:hypothetical protein